MQLIDANIILRYLLKDNEKQAEEAAEAVRSGAFTTIEVLAEVVYVLSRVYKIPRDEISWMIHCVLLDVEIDNLKAIRHALGLFSQSNLDFVDCVLISYHKALGIDVLSFDRKLNSNFDSDHQIIKSN